MTIGFGGSLPKEACSRSSPFAHWLILKVVAFLNECLTDSCSFEGIFFAWTAALGKILIMDNLIKGRVIIVDK